jgi:hypothetical protein
MKTVHKISMAIVVAVTLSAGAYGHEKNTVMEGAGRDFITCVENGSVSAISEDGTKMIIVQCRAKVIVLEQRKDGG